MPDNEIQNGCLFLRNTKDKIPDTNGIIELNINLHTFIFMDNFKTIIESINVSNVVSLCINIDNADDILRLFIPGYDNRGGISALVIETICMSVINTLLFRMSVIE